jgi:predicted N-acetyltransferase YhbS
VSADPLVGPEPLSPEHQLEAFDCGVESLNQYLIERAYSDQRADKSRTYVVARGDRVVGYFSVAAASIEPSDATGRAAKGQGAQPIPAVLIGRLAVAKAEQGQGMGGALLVEALRRSAAAAETIGARVVLVDALDEEARGFYAKFGFEASPTDPLHLMMLMKDIRKTLG